jgi:hypothetical protein
MKLAASNAIAIVALLLVAGCSGARPRSSHTARITSPESTPSRCGSGDGCLEAPPAETFAVGRAAAWGRYAHLAVAHMRQGHNLCVPTSAAMTMGFYGDRRDPNELKVLSKGDPSVEGTFYSDLVKGLEGIGYSWMIVRYEETPQGFDTGLRSIKLSLDEGKPVLVSLYVPPLGHTNVAIGYDEEAKAILLVDPDRPSPGLRPLTFEAFATIWHETHDHGRYAIFTEPKRGH